MTAARKPTPVVHRRPRRQKPTSRLALILAFAAATCATAVAAETRVTDATGRSVVIADSSRIVSVGGAVTETLHVLGVGDRVIAVDSTSLYPETVGEKPNVGYMRRLAAEPILALAPSLILAVEDSGPPTALEQLREAGVPVVIVPDAPSRQGVLDKVALLADSVDRATAGEALAAGLQAEFDRLENAIAEVASRPRVLFLLSIGRGGAPLAAGRDTSAAGIIALAGGENAIDGFEGYKPLSPEAAVTAEPDVILVTRRSLRLLGGMDGLLALPDVAATPAGRERRVVAMDGLLLLGFGPRTGNAIRQLANQLHPDLALAPAENRRAAKD